MSKLVSGKVKRTPQSGIRSDRYEFLDLEQSEPNLGDPLIGPSSIGANPIKVGTFYQLAAIAQYPGERFWSSPIGIGTTLGVISVYANDELPNNAFSRIHGLNFVGSGVTIETPPVELFDGIGIATVRFTVSDLIAPGNDYEIPYNDPITGLLRGSTGIVFRDNNIGIGSTLPKQKLDVNGNVNITNTLNVGGISTFNNVTVSSGIITASVGVVTYYGDGTNLTNVYAVYSNNSGISTSVIGGIVSATELNISGVSTLGTLKISSGVVTATSGLITYYGDYYGVFRGTLDPMVIVEANYTPKSGVSTSVIGGIASVTQLNVTGVSTLGVINISSGIISSTVGVVTYYGDGGNLINVKADSAGYATTAGISTVSQGLTGTPNIQVGIVTATEYYGTFRGIIDSGVVIDRANYANFAGVATVAGYASTSGFSTVSNYANFAGIATNAGYATTAGVSTISNYANFAGIATIAGYASTSGISTLSNYSNFAGISTYSDYSGIATISGYASTAGIATYANISGVSTVAGYATTAGIATYANISGVSTVAGYATTAGIATISEYALIAGIATYATTAGIATVAGYATTAGISTVSQGLTGTPNIQVGIVTATEYYGIFKGSIDAGVVLDKANYANFAGVATVAGYASTSGISTVSQGLTGTPNIQVGIVTATTLSGSGDSITNLNAGNLTSGIVPAARITDTNKLSVNGDLFVSGNISFGGTTTQLNAQQLQIIDPDIILGIGTSFSPSDNTANHGGIAIASTEGSPLVDLNITFRESTLPTYKKFMWFKNNTAGLGTDAWLSNYAVGIGSTQFPTGTRLAVGSIQFLEDDLSVIRNINSSGIVTAIEYYGVFKGTIDGVVDNANYASTAGFSTISNYSNFSGISTVAGYATTAGIATISEYALIAGISTLSGYASTSGISTVSNYANFSGIATIAGYASTAGVSTVSQGLIGTPNIQVGIVTATEYYGTFKGTIDGTVDRANYATTAGFATNAGYASTAGIATTAGFATNAGYASTAGIATTAGFATNAGYASTAGVSTVSQGLTGTPNIQVGILTATEYYGTFKGIVDGTVSKANYATTAGVATALQNLRTFEITGDIIAAPVTFNGTGNVSLSATIQPNSVALGTDTFGDYVQSISGTTSQIVVTGGTGEGSTPVLSFSPNPLLGGNVTIGNDLQVNRNLNVDGNITVGGTNAYFIVKDFRVNDPDIILGFTTNSTNNDTSNDTTANRGGISIASTEGNPLIELINVSIGETLPSTYKKFKWFKSGSFTGLGTDSWLSNYAIGIGSTQFPSGTTLAAGSVQFSRDDLAVVRNINSSGIITGTLANNLRLVTSGNGISGIATYNNSGITTFTITSNATSANTANTLVFRAGGGNFSAGTITATLNGSATYSTSSGVSTSVIGGISSVTSLIVSGISTLGSVLISSGIVSATSGIVTYYGDGSKLTGVVASGTGVDIRDDGVQVGTASTIDFGSNLSVSFSSGIATVVSTAVGGGSSLMIYDNFPNTIGFVTSIDFGPNLIVSPVVSGIVTVSPNGGTATNVIGGIASVTQLNVSGISTLSGNLDVDSGTLYVNSNNNRVGVLTTSPVHPFQVGFGTNSFVVTGVGSVGIGTTDPTSALTINGDLNFIDNNPYNTTIQVATATTDNTITFPNSTGTVALVAGLSNQVTFNLSGVQSASSNFTYSDSNGLILSSGPILIGSGTSTGTSTQRLQVTGGSYISGNTGIGTTIPRTALHVIGNSLISGVTTSSNGFNASTGGDYEINDIVVLNSTTLGSGVTNSSLTSLGTLRNLNVSGVTTTINLNVGLGGTIITTTGIGSVGIGSTNPRSTLVVNSASSYTGNILDLQTGGNSVFNIDYRGSFNSYFDSGLFKTNQRKISFWVSPTIPSLGFASDTYIGWGSGSNDDGTHDAIILRDASNIIAQRNGSNSQIFRTYNTFTSSTNFERSQVGFVNNTFIVGTEKGSTGGTARPFHIQTDGITRVAVTSTGSVGIASTLPTTSLDVNGSATFTDIRLNSVSEKSTLVSGNTINLVYNTGGGNIAICTNPTGPITLNITGIPTDNTFDNRVLTFTVVAVQTSTGYACTTVNLNGVSRTVRYPGSIVSVGSTGSYDIFNFTGINTVGSASTTANYQILGMVNGNFR